MKFLIRFLTSIVVFTATVSHAQDVLKLKDEQLIQVKIIEITTTEIKYKKFDNQAGPIYTINKTDAQEITYENGTKETMDSLAIINSIKKQKSEQINLDIEKRKSERIEKAKIDYERSMQLYNRRIKGARPLIIAGPTILVGGIGLTALGGRLLELYDPGGYNFNGTYKQPTGNLGGALSALIPGVAMLYTGLGLTVAGSVKLAMARKYKHRAEDAKAILSFEPSMVPNNLAMNDRSAITGFSLKLKF